GHGLGRGVRLGRRGRGGGGGGAAGGQEADGREGGQAAGDLDSGTGLHGDWESPRRERVDVSTPPSALCDGVGIARMADRCDLRSERSGGPWRIAARKDESPRERASVIRRSGGFREGTFVRRSQPLDAFAV